VNEKKRSYDKYITDLLGSDYLFENSVLCPQNSRKLTDMRTGEIRELFAEFLRLDRYLANQETAKQCINLLTASLGPLKASLDRIRVRIAALEDTERNLEELQVGLKPLEDEVVSFMKELETEQRRREERKAAIHKNDAARQRAKDLRAGIEAMRKDLDTERAKTIVELREYKNKSSAITNDINRLNKILQEKDAVLNASVRELELSVEHDGYVTAAERIAREIGEKQARLTGIMGKVVELRKNLAVLDADPTIRHIEVKIGETRTKLDELARSLSAAENDGNSSGSRAP
jgi:chromosome segregation ATPase